MKPFRTQLLLATAAALLTVAPTGLLAAAAGAPSAAALAAARENNLGAALMSQGLLEKAATHFAAATSADPALALAKVNLGLALLYQQKLPEAEAALKAATTAAPGDPHAWYALGLVYRSETKPADALDAFGKALSARPDDPKAPGAADAHYFLGTLLLEQGKAAEAEAQFRSALAAFPMHASAQFGLARSLQREGKTAEAHEAFARFQHITSEKLASPFSHTYGEEGTLARVEDVSLPDAAVGPMLPVTFDVAWQPALSGMLDGAPHPAQTCVIDLAPAGAPPSYGLVFVSWRGVQLFHNASTPGHPRFEPVPPAQSGFAATTPAFGCAVGDYDNDGLPDLAVATFQGVQLFRNSGSGKFEDVSTAAGLKPLNHPASVLFVDYDHDGDLDLLAPGTPLGPSSAPTAVYRNNGNKTFTDATQETALGGTPGTTTTTALPSDLNNDRAIDLLMTGPGASPTIAYNPREGAWPATPLGSAVASPVALANSAALATLDFNKDGWMDLALATPGGLVLLQNTDGSHFQSIALPGASGAAITSVVALDFDNDGWVDLVALAGGHLRAWRNQGPAGWAEVTTLLGLDKIPASAQDQLLAFDADRDGAADLVLSGSTGVTLAANHGASANHSLAITLKGVADNRSGIGTKVEVFGNGLWQKWEAVGQPEVLAGLGSATEADVVRLLWPTGVPQDEIDVKTGILGGNLTTAEEKPLLLTETDRRGSSCPTLFAWDGARYSFVSDVIGAGVVGHWVSAVAHNTPDPDEWIKIDGAQLRARDGMLSLRFGEPMEEVNYLDQVRLLAVDHPAGTAVFPHEGFLSEPPFATGEPVLSRDTQPPLAATDDHGQDALPVLAKIDRTYLRDFTNLPYAGFANPHSLTLDLGPRPAGAPVRLLLHGFVEYFSASSMYAAAQAGLKPVPPFVEAELPDGRWQRIVDDMGFPAGLPRTVVVDLTGKLPAGARRVRITTNLQLYWDQVLVDTTPNDVPRGTFTQAVRTTELPLAHASLAFRGYPEQRDGRTPGDLVYNYSRISATGPFLPQRGAYTRYGEVTPLLAAVDNRYVIFGTGEDMDLEFATAALPPLRKGEVRDYFFYANGYVKDMDFYEAQPFSVATLPFHGMTGYPYSPAEHYPEDSGSVAYQLEWNTRWESGTAARAFDFDYEPSAQTPEPIIQR